MLRIGCHLSATKGFEHMGREALSIGADTFAFFTRNPRGGKAKEIDEKDVAAFLELAEKNNFGKLVAHAPYTLNPCSAREEVREFAYMAMKEDLQRMEYLPGNYYNFHPGSHTGLGREKGIELITELLNRVLTEDQTTVVLLESMAGKGTEIGGTFEDLAEIISGVKLKNRMGVCLDSCHISDGGYDIISDLDGVLDRFDQVVGLEYLKAFHLNDSMNPAGARKDRHEKIGQGYLGLDTFVNIINNRRLQGLSFILETPNELDGYRDEIALLRSHYREPAENNL